MKLFGKINVDAKTVWGIVGVGASLIGLIAGQKNDEYKQQTLTNEAAEKAAEMVLEKLTSNED